jgi:GT2 family glycosyltransferase
VTIAAVLPTYNRLPALRANLGNILAIAGLDEVLVVDDGSSDGTWEWLAGRRDGTLRPVRHRANRGSPAARNTGAAAARSAWVLFVEDDCRFPGDYAQILLATAQRHDVAIVGAPMVHPGPHGDLAAAVAAARSAPVGDNGLDGVAGFPDAPVRTPLLPAPALVRRDVFEDVQFDPGYTGNGYREETDFFLRAEQRGHRCLLTGDTYFWEPLRYPGGQPRNLAAEWHTLRNNWRFLRRHRDWLVGHGHIRSPLREQMAFSARRVLGASRSRVTPARPAAAGRSGPAS